MNPVGLPMDGASPHPRTATFAAIAGERRASRRPSSSAALSTARVACSASARLYSRGITLTMPAQHARPVREQPLRRSGCRCSVTCFMIATLDEVDVVGSISGSRSTISRLQRRANVPSASST